MSDKKIILAESEIPKHWYNIVADMPNPPMPVLGPDGNPVTPDMLTPLFAGGVMRLVRINTLFQLSEKYRQPWVLP